MKQQLYITQHLGLGDSIICQSIVKHFANIYKVVTIPVYDKYIESIDRIYEDYDNVKYDVYQFKNVQDKDTYTKIRNHISQLKCQVLKLGIFSPIYDKILRKQKTLNSTFYLPTKLGSELQWKYTPIKRNKEKQIELFKMYNLIQGEYVLFIEDKTRKNHTGRPLSIKRKFIKNKGLKVVTLERFSNDVFDNCYLIENAKQIHLYDSCFTHVIDQVCSMNDVECYLHKYMRPEQKIARNVYRYNFINIQEQ